MTAVSAEEVPPRKLDPWNETDLGALLTLERIGATHFRTRYGDPNPNGRSYGGQLLGQAMAAASLTVPPGRPASALQFLFLQGALYDAPIDLHVTALQDGKRFSSRHVRGIQSGGRIVLDAHATYAEPMVSPGHSIPSGAREQPESLPRLQDMPLQWGSSLGALRVYSMAGKPCLDFRIPQAEEVLREPTGPQIRFWLRVPGNSSDPRFHENAFAYVSDWWLNYSSLCLHMKSLLEADRQVYIASLNHAIWFHRQFRVDKWLHVHSESAFSGGGRGLSVARVHDENGLLVATTSQECLLAYADRGSDG